MGSGVGAGDGDPAASNTSAGSPSSVGSSIEGPDEVLPLVDVEPLVAAGADGDGESVVTGVGAGAGAVDAGCGGDGDGRGDEEGDGDGEGEGAGDGESEPPVNGLTAGRAPVRLDSGAVDACLPAPSLLDVLSPSA